MSERIKVLSIDGGGIRGMIPAIILASIEERTGKPVSELFDLIAGTSTGGILTLGLTKPNEAGKPQYAAMDMVELYEKEGPTIFSRSVWHKLRAIDNVTEEKYPSRGVESVLQKYFGETRLKDALTDVIITAYEIEQRFPFFFKSCKAKLKSSYDFPMWQVARSTSAAPTYFEPFKLETTELVDYYALVDGGVYANNPTLCAYVEAATTYPGKDLLVVSLGTGELTRKLDYNRVKDWGLINWAQPILDVVFDGVSKTTDHLMNALLRTQDDDSMHYFRLQVRLDKSDDNMDNAGTENIRNLKLQSEELLRDNNDEINRLCKQLTTV